MKFKKNMKDLPNPKNYPHLRRWFHVMDHMKKKQVCKKWLDCSWFLCLF